MTCSVNSQMEGEQCAHKCQTIEEEGRGVRETQRERRGYLQMLLPFQLQRRRGNSTT